ncbi:methyltransferase domain-containing protein [Skermanella pratensis]|uniref:methyltransferase domain-containing protein n=1 Tax=Skermanella pratensis TaxID=2233999 RepID=UPI001787DE1B|nr:methyltransferase domain-containing protein [Skermanella pratensis]
MEQIRKEVQRQSPRMARPASSAFSVPVTPPAPAPSVSLPPIARDDRGHSALLGVDVGRSSYHYGELLGYDGPRFVQMAYRVFLGREPDPEGESTWLEGLGSGRVTKPEMLWLLSRSAEGRHRGVRLSGLGWRTAYYRALKAPVVGRLFRAARKVNQLPHLTQSFGRMEDGLRSLQDRLARIEGTSSGTPHVTAKLLDSSRAMAAEVTQLRERVSNLESLKGLSSEIATVRTSFLARETEMVHRLAVLDQYASRLGVLESETVRRPDLAELHEQLEVRFNALSEGLVRRTEVEELNRQLRELVDGSATLSDTAVGEVREKVLQIQMKMAQLRNIVLDQERRVNRFLAEARARLPGEPLGADQIERMVRDKDDADDTAYLEFEDQFRGTRAEIKERQRFYLPFVRQTVDSHGGGVLDIGCGRGEWLELLKEHDIKACGIDMNRAMVRRSVEAGLSVTEGMAVEHLQTLPDSSLEVVTAFHVIEHLGMRELADFMQEVRRVLRPNGIAIFETPNPENLITGACNFYLDPTHRNPLPPATTKFLMENAGFTSVEIHPLHAQEFDHGITNLFLKNLLFGPQDYGAIGRKP